MYVALYSQDPHLEVKSPDIFGNDLRPGGKLQRFVIGLTVKLDLRKVEQRTSLAEPVAQFPVGITRLLETFFCNIPVKVVGLDIAIKKQAIGLEGLQLEF